MFGSLQGRFGGGQCVAPQHRTGGAVAVRPLRPVRASGAADGEPSTSTPSAPTATKAPVKTVVVHFRQEGKSTTARPGEDLMEAASRAGADIPTGCLHGSCGVCEVELFRLGPGGAADGGPVVVRACVAKVPGLWERVEVGMMDADSVWGQDGWDT